MDLFKFMEFIIRRHLDQQFDEMFFAYFLLLLLYTIERYTKLIVTTFLARKLDEIIYL